MKKKFSILICLVVGLAIFNSCKKDPVPPTLTTSEVINITVTSATSGGVITKDGGAGVSARGICWSTSLDPSLSDSHTTDGTGVGSFVSNLADLTPNTVYHIRAYATNKAGTAYGTDVSFTTTAQVAPSLTTNDITAITLTTAVSGGNISSDGNAAITAKGVCWATTTAPTVSNFFTTDGTGAGTFVSNLSGLLPGTTYYVRAYATNSVGTSYGNEVSFATTSVAVPTLTTAAITAITLNSATSGGNITADGGAPVTARGVCWSSTLNPTVSNSKTIDNSGVGTFVSSISSLQPGTVYHVRAYATNSAGTAYGNDLQFTTTAAGVPVLTTASVTGITQTTAVSGGNITSDGGTAVTARGICWATTTNPTVANSKTSDASGTGSFVSNLTGLTPGTVYYVRAYATNSVGTAYGIEVSFTSTLVNLPTLTTASISAITATTAVTGGNVLSSGGATVTGRGVCWGSTLNPTISGNNTTDGSGTGAFVSSLSGLTPGATYHVRAYAVNSGGTAYGNDVVFTTLAVLPTVTTTAASAITPTTATAGGNITADGGGAITARGTCFSITANPTIAGSKTSDATGAGIFTSSLTSLLPGTTYHIRAYATNSAGTSYGSDLTFTTLVDLPTVTTTAASAITQLTATAGGNVTSAGGGTVTARGICYGITANPTISGLKTSDASGTGSFVSSLSGLTSGTLYHIRAYATNSAGTSYGSDLTFTTNPATLATLTTNPVTSATDITAVSGGNISSDGNGAITEKGVVWATHTAPVISTDFKTSNGTGTASFVSNLTALSPATTYYVRAFATNAAGTAYGDELTFNTMVADADGNLYNFVVIGTQVFFKENLATTKYSDGTNIPVVPVKADWAALTTPAVSWYNNDASLKDTYGALYNWFAVDVVSNGGKNVCPTGWHVPSDTELETLKAFLGGQSAAGGKLKEAGIIHWTTPNTGADNSTGFTALPGGYRTVGGDYVSLGLSNYLWSSTSYSVAGFGLGQGLRNINSDMLQGPYDKADGASVRCLKN